MSSFLVLTVFWFSQCLQAMAIVLDVLMFLRFFAGEKNLQEVFCLIQHPLQSTYVFGGSPKIKCISIQAKINDVDLPI